jgi:hypothetical protein
VNAKVTYVLRFEPHPWNPDLRAKGIEAWCLVRRIEPEYGPMSTEAVAIFNFDSAAEVFAGHIFAAELDKKLVDIGEDFRNLFLVQQRNR